jgi:hypothetical protein
MRTRWDTLPRRLKRPGMMQGGMAAALYGSKQTCGMVRDAIIGANSLDVVTIGDSNTTYTSGGAGNGGSGGGWLRGFARALQTYGASVYGSQWTPCMASCIPTSSVVLNKIVDDDGKTRNPFGFYQNIQKSGNANILDGASVGPTGITAAITPAQNLFPYGLSEGSTYTQQGWNYAWIAAATTSQTFQQSNATEPGGTQPTVDYPVPSWLGFNTAGLRQRTVYATTSTSGGSIKPTWYKVTFPGAAYTQLGQGNISTYNASGVTIAASDVPFTMSGSDDAQIWGWNYIGITTGPAAAWMESAYRQQIGISAHSLHGHPGGTSTQIATAIAGCNTGKTFLENYLTQVYNRQTAGSTATGRVLVLVNFGINGGGDTAATWTTNATSVVDTITAAWLNAGLPINQLGFLCMVTHALNTFGASTENNLILARAAANAWAASKTNVVVADLSQIYSGAQMTANGYYMGTGSNEAHLKQAGYLALSNEIVRRMAASA